jgi:hypothetical protein
MFEITRASRCHSMQARALSGVLVVAVICSVLAASVAVGKPFKNEEIAKALSGPTLPPPEAEQVAKEFLENTLPRLAASDPQAAARFGFTVGSNQDLVIEKSLALQILNHPDIFKFTPGQSDPLDLVNNEDNWTQGVSGTIVSKRLMVLFSWQGATPASGSTYQSSVTLEQTASGSWRVIQAGAPRLSRAIYRFQTPDENQFVMWIPDLNRHYLAYQKKKDPDAPFASVFFTALFNDRLAYRSAGETFDATSPQFFKRLKQLYQDLDLPGRLRGQAIQGAIVNPTPGVKPNP